MTCTTDSRRSITALVLVVIAIATAILLTHMTGTPTRPAGAAALAVQATVDATDAPDSGPPWG